MLNLLFIPKTWYCSLITVLDKTLWDFWLFEKLERWMRRNCFNEKLRKKAYTEKILFRLLNVLLNWDNSKQNEIASIEKMTKSHVTNEFTILIDHSRISTIFLLFSISSTIKYLKLKKFFVFDMNFRFFPLIFSYWWILRLKMN